MKRKETAIEKLSLKIFNIWQKTWLLLTCGDEDNFNTMTVGWGSFGTVWNKPFAQIFVRPTRHTWSFCNNYPFFTLCSFPQEFQNDLSFLGSKSGKDCDKISLTRLHVEKSKKVPAPSFVEADLAIECRKIYWGDLIPGNFLDDYIPKCYPEKDYHRVFYGEILHVEATEPFF
ncbi:flavin reductase family protein [candidate division WOR-3 bacterium]|nr:flavin reductase family protein [candidate division WOR-3 bacterium]